MKYSSRVLDHLGIVSVMCDEIGISEMIDAIIPPDPRMYISYGECVKLMIINGLGFTSRPLYLEANFFSSKATERFLGRDIDCDQITDDRLGRCLDALWNANLDTVFSRIAYAAAKKFEVDRRFRHCDTTSMTVHGEYASDEEAALITYGYSKDHRPDLKQFVVSLVCSQDGDVPLLARTVAGNTSDTTHFREVLSTLKQELSACDEPTYLVADSALYCEATIQELSSLKWITRVPERIKLAKQAVTETAVDEMDGVGDGYSLKELRQSYGGIEQRWVVVFSEKGYQREKATLEKQIKRLGEKKATELNRLLSVEYECPGDAFKALKRFESSLTQHQLDQVEIHSVRKRGRRGRPKKDEEVKTVYKATALLLEDPEKKAEALRCKGKFIIATNELDKESLSAIDLLSHYKEQQSVERGFRFLKDPYFFTSSIFLKTPERIQSLSMIMCLCLLVYTLTQRHLRLQLRKKGETIPNQVGKQTSLPTLRWVYIVFEGVHVLYGGRSDGLSITLNMTATRDKILSMLGPPYEKIYGVAA